MNKKKLWILKLHLNVPYKGKLVGGGKTSYMSGANQDMVDHDENKCIQ